MMANMQTHLIGRALKRARGEIGIRRMIQSTK